jgi:NIMA (never in mitosis gene a)-related kinase
MNKKLTTLQDFQILGRLGEGSFGEVFKVKRIEDGEIYAMKKVTFQLTSGQNKCHASKR